LNASPADFKCEPLHLFDLENRYASLIEAGDPLERLDAAIDWEIFRPILVRIDAKERKSAAGRKADRDADSIEGV